MGIKLSFKDAVLAAIANGVGTVEELSRVFMVREEFIKRIIDELKTEGLVKEVVRGFWIFRKKTLKLTSEGFKMAEQAMVKLRELASEVKAKMEREISHEELRRILEPYMPVIPLLVYLNLLDLLLLDMLFAMPLITWWDTDFIDSGETYLE